MNCEFTGLAKVSCSHCTGTLGPNDALPDDDAPRIWGPESKGQAKREIGKLIDSAYKHRDRRHIKQRRR